MDTSTQMNPELLQIQNRLLNLTNQIDLIHTNIDRLTTDMRSSGVQIDSLTRNLTHPDASQQIADNWSEIFVRLEEYQDKMDGLLSIARQSAGSQQLTELSQALLDTNGHVARNQEQLDELAKSLKKLTRTQFKANTLVESKDQHLNTAFSTLQDMATQREAATEEQSQQAAEEVNQLRKNARTELVAEMLPAIDSLERALASGTSLSERQKQEVENYLQNTSIAMPLASMTSAVTPKKSTWGRLISALVNAEEPTPQPLLPSVSEVESAALIEQAERHAANLSQMTANSDAWLDGLHLVRERFLSVLATENVEPIPALGEPFDPRLHVAVSTENSEDVANNTIVDVLRSGYYQDGRILRYAEVSVARNESAVEPKPVTLVDEPSQEDYNEHGEHDDSNSLLDVVGSAVVGGAVVAAVDASISHNDDPEIDPEIDPESEAEIDIDLETPPEIEVSELNELPNIDIAPVDTLPEIDFAKTDSAGTNLDVDVPAIEGEPILSPEQMSDYVPAVSRAYIDENAAERTSIVNYMLGKPTKTDEGIYIESDTKNDTAEVSAAHISSIFDTDEQVSMSREMDEETFASLDITEMNDNVANNGIAVQDRAYDRAGDRAGGRAYDRAGDTANSIRNNMSNSAAGTPYPDKTNVQSDISWVQYESPKRKSWLTRFFGSS